MRYMIDSMYNGWARELREKGYDCQTVVKLLRGNEDSSVQVRDPEILKYLEENRSITLITADRELVEYCRNHGIRAIYILEVLMEHLGK